MRPSNNYDRINASFELAVTKIHKTEIYISVLEMENMQLAN
jgi:hypothetical protein